jgi:hypothetical protein
MARTIGDVITQVRDRTNDTDAVAYRIATVEHERNIYTGLLTVFDIRPDIFLGQHTTFPPAAIPVSADLLPIADQWFPALVDYGTFAAEFKDDEYAVGGRAGASYTFFKQRLLG